jgi:hypothetical protein
MTVEAFLAGMQLRAKAAQQCIRSAVAAKANRTAG